MEVIEYFHEHKLNGILGLHPDYIIANTNRYFSSHDLRLSYKGSLETKEYLVSKVLSSLSLTPDHLPFIAVFLGGYILIDEATLKLIYHKMNVDFTTDYESRIKKLAEIVRNSPTNDLDEFIKHLNLAEWAEQIKTSVEYYQRKGKFAGKHYVNHRKAITAAAKQQQLQANDKTVKDTPASVVVDSIDLSVPTAPLASETSENDEFSRKLLDDVNNLVDDGDDYIDISSVNDAIVITPTNSDQTQKKELTTSVATTATTATKVTKPQKNGKSVVVPFVYTLPGEVLKTSLNRHQRGIMDPRIYQLLIKKEIFLPQV